MDEFDIPEAIREGIDLPRKSSSALFIPLIVGGILGLGIVGLLTFFLLNWSSQSSQTVISKPIVKSVTPKAKIKQSSSTKKKPVPAQVQQKPELAKQNPELAKQNPEVAKQKPSKDDLLGHLPYDVAPQTELTSITNDGSLTLRNAAAVKFQHMQSAARADGINLIPISAFRTAEAQEQLFFGVKEQRVQDAAKRAKVSAPPGYSEHHTGYALDLGDGSAPATNVEPEFANTAAFRWLNQNAPKYSFELSFPPDNEQGVSYEPWHWRFVGDRDSLETFYKVRN